MNKNLEIDGIFSVIDLWANNAVRSNKIDGASVYNPYNAKELSEAIYNAGYRKVDEVKQLNAAIELKIAMDKRVEEVRKETAKDVVDWINYHAKNGGFGKILADVLEDYSATIKRSYGV